MQAELNKWGNSLAIRIPSQMAKELGISQGSLADITLDNGRIVVTPAKRKPSLKHLLASMKTTGKEQEIPAGGEMGNEAAEW
ncbi:AbrB/MazE/SpoVT family DNA-binding domain-containing protein [bacterium]|nr:AbrB/MazE/SpoVT family DNA-binding domain-containing protein [bacterium]